MFRRYPDVVTVSQMCEMLGIGKNTAYRILNDNTVKALKIGKVYKIPKKNIAAYVTKKSG